MAPAAATAPVKERAAANTMLVGQGASSMAASQPRATMSAASGLTRKLGRGVPKGPGDRGSFGLVVPRRGEYYNFGESLTVHWINNGGEACPPAHRRRRRREFHAFRGPR